MLEFEPGLVFARGLCRFGQVFAQVEEIQKIAAAIGELADFNPKTLAIMHGSSFSGDGGRLLRCLDPIFKSVFGGNLSIAESKA